MNAPTFQALYDAYKAEVQSRRADLTDWNEGSVLDGLGGGSAMLADESMRYYLALFSELFFDTAVGAALDRLALDRLGLERKPATAAYGTVTWTKGDSGAAYDIPAGTVFRATLADGTTYTASSLYDVSIRADQVSVPVAVQADAVGRSSNLAVLTLDEVATPLVADPTATCTNTARLAGGSDAETDAAFRDRIRRYYSTLRRGTVDALKTGALSVPGVAFVTVDESTIEDDGIVRVYVGDPDASSNSTLASLVETELENWRAAGVMVEVLGAGRDDRYCTLQVEIERGADLIAAAAAIRAAVIGHSEAIPPGRPARLSRIANAVHDASASVLACVVTSLGTAEGEDIEPAHPHLAVRFGSLPVEIYFTEVDS